MPAMIFTACRPLVALALLLAAVAPPSRAADAPHPRDVLRDDAALLVAPAATPAEGFKSADPRIRGVFLDVKPYNGRATRAFAWVGVPKVEPGKAVPGMVLVHGGGGTAFDKWV